PSPDGKSFILNGEKRYITNGGIAKLLTVMARTPVPGSNETKITAFLVTPDLPGFKVVEARMPKCGIRGTATGRLAFHDMRVPAENVLGPVGKGLRIALTVLDFGRTTFGASCIGAAKTCLRAAVQHAKRRKQFKQSLAEFELVKKKIAYMGACAFAMVGIKPVADVFLGVKAALSHPFRDFGKLLRFGRDQISARLTRPKVPVQHAQLHDHARALSKRVRDFSLAVQRMLIRHRENI